MNVTAIKNAPGDLLDEESEDCHLTDRYHKRCAQTAEEGSVHVPDEVRAVIRTHPGVTLEE